MHLLMVIVIAAAVLAVAYYTYGALLARLLRLDRRETMPAVAQRDDVDYVPIARMPLLSQHFSAIAAAGPIVGPILAAKMFGWFPALLWILLGSIFIGGVHDLTALMASVRHKARSIAEVVREHMSKRAYVLFLAFIWLALVYVVVAFTDITARSFIGIKRDSQGTLVSGAGIASSSLLYLLLPVVMGLLMRFARLPAGVAVLIFLPLVGVSIWLGQRIPLDVGGLLGLDVNGATRAWCVLLLVYCFIASVVPMWLLLQPRGMLGGYFLLIALVGGMLGLALGGHKAEYPAFIGWQSAAGQPLFPLLFITVACGACSGFHAMVASGATSKQLRCATDARPIAYGGMLLEAMVAVVSVCCVMMLPIDSTLLSGTPSDLYAAGIGEFLGVVGVPRAFAISFALMAFTTFVYDTLDVCTRLGRYVLQELLGLPGALGRLVATTATTAAPLWFLLSAPVDPKTGAPVETWKVFWNLFGASNQLLAALTLIGVTVWLWRTRQALWVWPVTGLPAAFMYVISVWELSRTIRDGFARGLTTEAVPWVAVLLVVLALLVLLEALRVFVAPSARPPDAPHLSPATA